MKAFYIDAVNIDCGSGTGGIPLYKDALRHYSDVFYFVGFSGDYKKNEWHGIKLNENLTNFFSLKCINNKLISRNLLFTLLVFLKWRKIKKIDNRCNVVFTRTYSVLWLFSFILKGFKVVYYAPGLGNPIKIGRFSFISSISNLYKIINFRALQKASSLLAAASKADINAINTELAKRGSKIFFNQVPESVDYLYFAPQLWENAQKNLNLPIELNEEDLVFSFIGRIAKVKGINLIIDGFNVFLGNYPRSYLFLAGEGEMRTEINDYILQKGLGKHVIMLGNYSSAKVVSLINVSKACLYGSYFEGFSVAMLEVLSCGKPIVSTDVSGVDELILPNKTGIVVYSRDPLDYSNAMEQVVKLQDCRNYCRSLIINNYSKDRQWGTILKTLDQLMQV